MSTSRDGPNPLRPYYIPPSIGLSQDDFPGPSNNGTTSLPKNGSPSTYASTARDMFSDIDYSDYVSDSSQSTLDTIKELLDQAMYKYMSVLLAQPFEVAKTVLQVRSQAGGNGSIPLITEDGSRDQEATYRESMCSEVCMIC